MKGFKHGLKAMMTVGISVFLSFLLMSCGEKVDGYTVKDGVYKNDNSTAMVLVLGKHANAMEVPEDAYKQIEKRLENAVYGGYICAIIVDADPTKIELVEDDFFVEDARNVTILKKRIETRKNTIINMIKEIHMQITVTLIQESLVDKNIK